MKVELIFCLLNQVDDELTLSDLADLAKSVNIDYVDERIEFIIRVVSSSEALIQIVKRGVLDDRGTSCLVISDQLINDDNTQSKIAEEICEDVRNSSSVCGLIALTEQETPHVQGIDVNNISGRTGREKLRDNIVKITARLWYKQPPINLFRSNKGNLFSLEIIPIIGQEALQKSLALRGRVYASLGYINLLEAQTPIEMDAYDLTAIHFLVIDHANRDRVAGTMRLIVPGLNAVVSMMSQHRLDTSEEWVRNIAKNHPNRKLWRAIEHGSQSALPVFDAFTYFDAEEELKLSIDKSLMPRNVCELSRVIVAPEYRGMGISSLLVNHALKVAKELKRQYVWLECAPHHIGMYEKCGFTVKDYKGQHFYKRAQRLDTWAVAMSLDIKKGQCLSDMAATVCYRLQIAGVSRGDCSLLFRFSQRSEEDVEHIFNSPINDEKIVGEGSIRGVSAPLKKLIPSALSCLDVKNFIVCLKALMKEARLEKLSLQHSSGRTFSFYPEDVNSSKRESIEFELLQWLR